MTDTHQLNPTWENAMNIKNKSALKELERRFAAFAQRAA